MSAAPAPPLPAELFDLAFRRNPIPAGLTRLADGVVADVNDAYLHLTGYRRDEVMGRAAATLGRWARPEDRARINQALAERRSVREAEYDLDTRAGETHRVLALLQDLTERERMHAELRRSVERFELVGRSTTDAVYAWNMQTGRTRWNHGMRTLFGYPVDAEQLHQWWRELLIDALEALIAARADDRSESD